MAEEVGLSHNTCNIDVKTGNWDQWWLIEEYQCVSHLIVAIEFASDATKVSDDCSAQTWETFDQLNSTMRDIY